MRTVVSESIKNSRFDIQVDETMYISGKAQLLAYIRFIYNNKRIKPFIFCKELEKHNRGEYIFQAVSEYFEKAEISWNSSSGIWTIGDPIMTGNVRGLVAIVKKLNPDVITT